MINNIDADFYYEENVAYARVTRILNCYPKPALYNWYAKHGLKKCREIMQNARGFGTEVHKRIHANLAGDLQAEKIDLDDKRLVGSMHEFFKWKKDNNPQPKHLEYSLINKRDMYGGTVDFIGEINGKMSIADWKTSGAVYEDYPLQIAAYYTAYKLMHPDEEIEEGRVVVFRCDDEGKCKTMEEKYSAARLEDLYKVFLNVKGIFDYKYGPK